MSSFAVQMLEKVELLLLGKVVKDAQSYAVNGRSITKFTIAELMELRKTLKAEIESEELKAALDAKGVKRIKAVRYV
jgi:hypothetical protein